MNLIERFDKNFIAQKKSKMHLSSKQTNLTHLMLNKRIQVQNILENNLSQLTRMF